MKGIFDGFNNFKDPSKRDYASMCVFGNLGQGKSSFLSQLAVWYNDAMQRKETARRVLIVDPSNAVGFNRFPSITLAELQYGIVNKETGKTHLWGLTGRGIRVLRGVKWANTKDWFKVLNGSFANGMVILDESRIYAPQNGDLDAEVTEFFTKHRNQCVDVVLVSHDFMSLNLKLRKAFRYYIVFKTGDKPRNEAWFTERSLPEQLYSCWQIQQRIEAPSAIIKPFIVLDTGSGKFQLKYDDPSKVFLVRSDPKNPTKRISIPFTNIVKNART